MGKGSEKVGEQERKKEKRTMHRSRREEGKRLLRD